MEPASSAASSEDVPSPPPIKESSPSPTASDPPPSSPPLTSPSAPPPSSDSSPPPNPSTSSDKPPSNSQDSPKSPPAPPFSPPPQLPAVPAGKPSPSSPVNSSPLPKEASSTPPAVREPATPAASQGLPQSPPSPTGFSSPSSPLPPNEPALPLTPNEPALPSTPETPSSPLISPPTSGGSPSSVSSSISTDTKGLNVTVIPPGYSDHASGHNAGIAVAAAAVVSVLLIMVIAVFLFARKRRKRGEYVPTNNFSTEPDGGFYSQPPGYMGLSGPSNHSPGSQFSPLGDSFGSQTGNTHSWGTPDSGVIGSSKTLFSYEELMEITNGFSSENIIGEGGFGCVYKGCVQDGKMVAVKQLKVGNGQGDREFKAEVEIISRVHHRHLVTLVGYCISNNQRLLIYDFVPNKTLEHHLHTKGLPVLDWPKRLKIAIGSAKGLAYLHEDCHPKIIHRDIKSANILLDDDFEAQVADFGLARLNDTARSHVSTRVMGTFGYLAPEYASSGKLTDKSDVFSFGVVLLELITGRKPVDTTQPFGDESLVEWARPILLQAIESGDMGELVDPRLENNYAESELFRMVEVAAACVRHSALKRPSMVQVVRLLDSKNELSDLCNGVKFGKSIEYDSGQYSEDIRNFKRSAPGEGTCSELEASSGGEYASGDAHHGLPI